MYMIEVLLIVIIVLLLSFLLRRKEWYVVEWRKNESASPVSAPFSLEEHSIHERSISRVVLLNKDKDRIIHKQWVFSSYGAAQKKFDSVKDKIGGSSAVEKVFLRQQLAYVRSSAYRLPPKYHEMNEEEIVLLETYPYFNEWTTPNKPSFYVQRLNREIESLQAKGSKSREAEGELNGE